MSRIFADGVAAAGVDDVGGAELAGVSELVLQGVDGDDLLRAGQEGARDHAEADAAAADDDHGAAGLDLRRVRHGADARRHGAADEARFVEGHVLAHRDGAGLRARPRTRRRSRGGRRR